MAKTVDDYIADNDIWQPLLQSLRDILLELPLQETIKWGGPCYTYRGRNLVGMGAYKRYVALWFYQGALLSDPDKVLVNAQLGKTRAQRQWRLTRLDDVRPDRIHTYVKEAMANQDAGKRIEPARGKPVLIPDCLQRELQNDPEIHAAWQKMTKGKQREFALHISEAKREDTRQRRLAKALPMIRAGAGLNDRYR